MCKRAYIFTAPTSIIWTFSYHSPENFLFVCKVALCKPFTICTTDGFVIDMLGPYLASKNDAEVLKNILEDSNDLRNFVKESDIFVIDRGFRDVVCSLEEKSLKY